MTTTPRGKWRDNKGRIIRRLILGALQIIPFGLLVASIIWQDPLRSEDNAIVKPG